MLLSELPQTDCRHCSKRSEISSGAWLSSHLQSLQRVMSCWSQKQTRKSAKAATKASASRREPNHRCHSADILSSTLLLVIVPAFTALYNGSPVVGDDSPGSIPLLSAMYSVRSNIASAMMPAIARRPPIVVGIRHFAISRIDFRIKRPLGLFEERKVPLRNTFSACWNSSRSFSSQRQSVFAIISFKDSNRNWKIFQSSCLKPPASSTFIRILSSSLGLLHEAAAVVALSKSSNLPDRSAR
mmetsp:Transcript_16764/g.29388  ORF Transcript_16764/g.29388 Transcript_16764/m.29388 type:complete len:242 (-) Transcript_16764:711-1436(-)